MKVAMVIALIAIAVFAIGLPAVAETGQDGPTPPELADPVQDTAARNEIQVISLGGATGGTWRVALTAGGPYTVNNSYLVGPGTLQTRINAIAGTGSVVVAGAAGGPFTVTFSGGTFLETNQPSMVLDAALLTFPPLWTEEPHITTVQNGGPAVVGSQVAPHGGYSESTDFCLQCHQVHYIRSGSNYVGEYARLAENSVTDTCNTCHGYEGVGPTGAADPGLEGIEGTASRRAVYTNVPRHVIGASFGAGFTQANWSYGWRFSGGPTGPSTEIAGPGTSSADFGGLYCASCHTPHGDFGQLINSKWAFTSAGSATGEQEVVPWETGTAIYWDDPSTAAHSYAVVYLYQAAPGDPWQVCPDTTYTGCSWAQVDDSEGQLVSLYGYKLLSSSPNHQYPTPATPPNGHLYADSPYLLGTLNTAITASAVSKTVLINLAAAPPNAVAPSPGKHLVIENEWMLVTAYTAPAAYPGVGTVTVGRGVDGTVRAAHAAGVNVSILAGTSRAGVRSWKTDIYNHDMAQFCGTCHSSAPDLEFGGQYHNHPTGCDACHGPNVDDPDKDFPHSSNKEYLLQEIPDALCINCHVAGSLP